MNFVLQYRGMLPSGGDARIKHHIRRRLSPQLADLWRQEPVLAEKLTNPQLLATGQGKGQRVIPTDGTSFSRDHYTVDVGGFCCIPLVTSHSRHMCQIELTFLRRGIPGAVVETGGDIDNRLKTLLDALRMPQSAGELAGCKPRQPDERLFCLLEDDRLITKISVEAKTLLSPVSARADKAVVLYINVTVFKESDAFKSYLLLEG